MCYLSYPKLVGSFGGGFVMFAVDVCDLPETGGSIFVVIAGLFVLVAGVIVTRWVRQSAGRLSVVVAPLVLLGGFMLAPQVVDPCAPATTTVAAATTTVAATTTTVAATTTTVAATTTTVAATTTTVALACASGGLCVVGDTGPGGGIVFYVHANGTFACGETLNQNCTYLEVAPFGDEVQRTWATGGNQNAAVSGADGTAIGTGEQNTADIVAQSGNVAVTSAAVYCSELVSGGQSDWFLPSKDELNLMYTNLHSASTPLGGFSTVGYWSSSEDDDSYAGIQHFSGYQASGGKVSTYYVRPVRAF